LSVNHLHVASKVDFRLRGVYIYGVKCRPAGRPHPHHIPDQQ